MNRERMYRLAHTWIADENEARERFMLAKDEDDLLRLANRWREANGLEPATPWPPDGPVEPLSELEQAEALGLARRGALRRRVRIGAAIAGGLLATIAAMLLVRGRTATVDGPLAQMAPAPAPVVRRSVAKGAGEISVLAVRETPGSLRVVWQVLSEPVTGEIYPPVFKNPHSQGELVEAFRTRRSEPSAESTFISVYPKLPWFTPGEVTLYWDSTPPPGGVLGPDAKQTTVQTRPMDFPWLRYSPSPVALDYGVGQATIYDVRLTEDYLEVEVETDGFDFGWSPRLGGVTPEKSWPYNIIKTGPDRYAMYFARPSPDTDRVSLSLPTVAREFVSAAEVQAEFTYHSGSSMASVSFPRQFTPGPTESGFQMSDAEVEFANGTRRRMGSIPGGGYQFQVDQGFATTDVKGFHFIRPDGGVVETEIPLSVQNLP